MKKVKGLGKKNPHRHRQQHGDDQREGGGGGGRGRRGLDGDGRRPDLGGEHTTQCTDDVL